MVTVSHVVHKLVDERMFLREAITRGIASHGSIAKQLKPEIEEELGKEVYHFAIVAALRRYAEKVETRFKDIKFSADTSEVNVKTNIVDINVLRTPSLFDKLKRIYDIIDFEKGDILHIIYGGNSVTIVTNERYKDKLCQFLHDEKIHSIEENLVALSFTTRKILKNTLGIIYQITRNLVWENINIIEIISIDMEITFIVEKKDAVKGYKTLQRLIL